MVAKEVNYNHCFYVFYSMFLPEVDQLFKSQWENMTFVTEATTSEDVTGEASTLVNFIFKDGLCIWTKVIFEQAK